jgi:hypothetical protein
MGVPLIALGVFAAASPFVFRFGVPQQAKTRIPSQAKVEIIDPVPGTVIRGSFIPVRVRLLDGRIVDQLTTKLDPTKGHLHLSIDGEFRMHAKESERVDIADLDPGPHLLGVEFVATDDGSFRPPVRSQVPFKVER